MAKVEGSKNSSSYFDNKMIEEEEMEKQVNDGAFDCFLFLCNIF